MMEWISINKRAPPRDNQKNPQNRNQNQNFRRDLPQNRPRENDQQIKPPFQDNYVDEGERDIEQPDESHLNLIGFDSEGEVFLTEEEQDFSPQTKMKQAMKIPKTTNWD